MNLTSPQPTQTTAPSRKLRVALFSGNYNYVVDGPVRALNQLVGYLERTGHEVLVFAPTIKNPPFDHVGELVSIPSTSVPGRSEYRVGFGLVGEARRRLIDFKPDLIHIAAPDFTANGAVKYAQQNNIPVVASFHTRFDTYPRYYGMRWAEKYLTNYMRKFYAKCVHVYPPSQSMIDALKDDGIGKDLRIWTRGVDADVFNPARRDLAWRRSHGIKDDEVVIVFVGRLVLEKGLEIFANAFDLLRAQVPNVRALIVGDGPERERL